MKTFLRSLVLSLVVLVGISSCCCHKKTTTSNKEQGTADLSAQGFTKVTVVKMTLDGCSFLLQLADGKKLEAVNLEEKYKKEGLVLWVKYTPEKKAMSICMAGEMVSLTEVKENK